MTLVMKNFLGRLTAMVVVIMPYLSFAHDHIKLNKKQKDSLKAELGVMLTNDQEYRWMVMLGETDSAKLNELRKLGESARYQRMLDVQKKVGLTKAVKDSLEQLMAAIDTANFSKLSAIIKKYGFPNTTVREKL